MVSEFHVGLQKRMGQDVRPDLAVSSGLLKLVLEDISAIGAGPVSLERKRELFGVCTYLVVTFCGSLRGNEGFMVDLDGLVRHLDLGREDKVPHVVVPLLGRFKNEIGERYHLILLANVTKSGLEVRRWVEGLVRMRAAEGRSIGPAFCDKHGGVVKSSVYEEEFFQSLERLQEAGCSLVDSGCVRDLYGLGRSLRRGAVSEARSRGVPEDIVTLVNRWRTVERAKGGRPSMGMRDHYSDIRLLKGVLVKFSLAL